MEIARLQGADIAYALLGDTGPLVVLIQGGRHPHREMEVTAATIAASGFRVLVHDRRNCGRSSLDFERLDPEEDVWVEDLAELMDHLGLGTAIVLGRSRGARIAIRFCLSRPDLVSALFLWGISAGRVALRFLDDYYFGKYIRACHDGGMDAVCRTDHFAGLVEADPANRHRLLVVRPERFVEVMHRRREGFLMGSDRPVMGISDEQLASIRVPTAVAMFHDSLHPEWAIAHAARVIPNAEVIEFEPDRRDDSRDERVVARLFCSFAESIQAAD